MPVSLNCKRRLDPRYAAIRGRNATRSRRATRPGIARSDSRHGPREGIAEAGEHLEHRQVYVRKRGAHKVYAAVVLKRAFEVIDELGETFADEVGGTAEGLRLLVFIVEAARDRVVRVVHLSNEIGNC